MLIRATTPTARPNPTSVGCGDGSGLNSLAATPPAAPPARSRSSAIEIADFTGSSAFLRERCFFARCLVQVKLTVRHGEMEVGATLKMGSEVREYFEDCPIPLRARLVRDVAHDLAIDLDECREDRLNARVRYALVPLWKRIVLEAERQARDPKNLALAWRRHRASRRCSALAK